MRTGGPSARARIRSSTPLYFPSRPPVPSHIGPANGPARRHEENTPGRARQRKTRSQIPVHIPTQQSTTRSQSPTKPAHTKPILPRRPHPVSTPAATPRPVVVALPNSRRSQSPPPSSSSLLVLVPSHHQPLQVSRSFPHPTIQKPRLANCAPPHVFSRHAVPPPPAPPAARNSRLPQLCPTPMPSRPHDSLPPPDPPRRSSAGPLQLQAAVGL